MVTEGGQKVYSILIADDQPMNLGVLSGMLRERGYHVRAVTNGRKALDAARASLPDLVMLDISMPEMDGYQACQEFKADPALASIPVIFISAHDQPLEKVRAFRAGGMDYVPKPFHVEEVLARVENQLRILDLQRDMAAKNAALLEANLKLEELDRLKASFTAMLVHDLRSPLGAARIMIEEILESGKINPRLLGVCDTHIEKAIQFLNDLLEVFRGESRGIHLNEESVDLRGPLNQVVEAYQVEAARKEIRLVNLMADDLPPVMGDRALLERVFSNLVSNALKFTHPGGFVTLRGAMSEGTGVDEGTRWVQVSVEDTGRGVPAESLPYLFDPYRQALASDSATGTGLGLAIVARIVAAHGGRVQVQSRESVGTRFTILFPAQ